MGGKNKSFYPFLFAIYPLFALFARLPGGLEPASLLRPMLILWGISFLFYLFYNCIFKNGERAKLLTAFTLLFFSSTGYLYRSVKGSLWVDAPAELHLFFVLMGVFLVFSLFHPLMWQKYLTNSRLRLFSLYLNIVSALVLLYPLSTIGVSLYQATMIHKLTAKELFNSEELPQGIKSNPLPDIYYIILDGYTRSDVLQDVYGYDNGAFIEALEERSFYIGEQSRSNYVWTMLSLTSSLNMSYLDVVADKIGSESAYTYPLYELNQQNRVRSFLKEAGYRTAAVSTDYPYTDWQDAEEYFYPYKTNPSEIERFYLSMTFLGAFYDAEFSFTGKLRNLLPIPSYSTRRDRIFYAFDSISDLVDVEGPKFVFVHILAPHPPFVVDKYGQPLEAKRPYSPTDGLGTSRSVKDYQQAYIEQLQFINQETLKAIDLILADSDMPKVILLQSDHGGGSLLSESVDASCLLERTSILNAYYFSNGNTGTLYPSISPVNSFRVILNEYFGTKYHMLPDITYFSGISRPFNFVDVSSRIETTCND